MPDARLGSALLARESHDEFDHSAEPADFRDFLPNATRKYRFDTLVLVGVDRAGLVGTGGEHADSPAFANQALQPLGCFAFFLFSLAILAQCKKQAAGNCFQGAE